MHAPVGAAFASCAQHILGTKPNLAVIDVQPADPPDDCLEQLMNLLEQDGGEGTLMLCDIYGATPFNIASRALKKAADQHLAVHLLTGTNLCMVLKALTNQNDPPEELKEKVRLGALRGIVSADGSV